MDNLTHGLAGALLAQAGFRQRYGRIALVALVVGAELPDIDAVFDLGGPVTGFQYHRGITHSFLGGAGLALCAAAVLYGLWRYRAYWRLVGLVYLGALLHIWMDYLTSYGTQIFLPFNAGRYTADAVFIIDFFYTGIILTALLVVRMVRLQRQARYGAACLLWFVAGWCVWLIGPSIMRHPLGQLAMQRAGLTLVLGAAAVLACARLTQYWPTVRPLALGRGGLVALALYMGLCMVNHEIAQHRFTIALAAQGYNVRHVAMLPMPGGPLRWRGIAELPEAYVVSRLHVFGPMEMAPQTVPKGLDLPAARTTSDYRLVRIFQDFARFPVVEYRQGHNEEIVRYSDLRFTGYGRDTSWFDLVVRLDQSGQVRMIEFLNHFFPPTHRDF